MLLGRCFDIKNFILTPFRLRYFYFLFSILFTLILYVKIQFTGTLVEPVNEIERFLHERRHLLTLQQMVEVVDIKHLKNYAVPTDEEPHSNIVRPTHKGKQF